MSEEEMTEQEESQEEKTEHQKKMEAAKEKIRKLEDDPPQNLEDWPDGQAKYETFGGPDGDHSYNEGPETNLGPDSVRHREDGSVEIKGEKVDNPDEFKGEPIPGGPTDPEATDNPDAQRLVDDDEGSGDQEASGDQGDSQASGDQGDSQVSGDQGDSQVSGNQGDSEEAADQGDREESGARSD